MIPENTIHSPQRTRRKSVFDGFVPRRSGEQTPYPNSLKTFASSAVKCFY